MRLAQPREAVASAPVERIGRDGARLALPDDRWTASCPPTRCAPSQPWTTRSRDSSRAQAQGALHFLEHGRAPTESVRRWQRGLHPVHSRIAGGCHLDRPIDDLITHAGLMIRELETGYGDGPRPFSYLYRGRAFAQREVSEVLRGLGMASEISFAYRSISPAA